MAYVIGLVVGTIFGTMLWGELAILLFRKFGLDRRRSVYAGAASTITLSIVGAILTDEVQFVYTYAVAVAAWTPLKLRGVAAQERAEQELARWGEKQRAGKPAKPPLPKRKKARPETREAIAETPEPPPAPSSLEKRCAACAASNDPDAKFCDACGTALDRTICTMCKTENRAKAAHCKACGTPLQAMT